MNQSEAAYIYHFETRDGLAVRVRRMTNEDTVHLVDIFDHMSPDSRYHRFHQPTEHLEKQFVWNEAQHMADLHNARGLLAFADLPGHPDTVIGGARYVWTGDGRAETAVSIRDDVQRRGIGTRLLQFITEEARLAGVTTLIATIQNDNRAIWRTLKHLPHPLKRMQDGVTSEIEIDLTTFLPPSDSDASQKIQFVGSRPNAI